MLLASLAYGTWISCEDIYVEGIDKIRASDIAFADDLGYRVLRTLVSGAVAFRLDAKG